MAPVGSLILVGTILLSLAVLARKVAARLGFAFCRDA